MQVLSWTSIKGRYGRVPQPWVMSVMLAHSALSEIIHSHTRIRRERSILFQLLTLGLQAASMPTLVILHRSSLMRTSC